MNAWETFRTLVPLCLTARKSIIAPVLPTLQQTVEVLTFQVAATALELDVPMQLKCIRTKTAPNTHREHFEKERAQKAQDMIEE